jgi:hypothetical protein
MASGDALVVGAQMQICGRYEAKFDPATPNSKLGIALNVHEGLSPINGLRHPPINDTNGWYIWAGETLSTANDFFQPLHIEHIANWCPQIVKFLALPPGWRFLIAGDYEDVWFDKSLLQLT